LEEHNHNSSDPFTAFLFVLFIDSMAEIDEEPRAKAGRSTRVKNKAPAPLQITAEQLLREALARQEAEPKPPKQNITDPEELDEYRQVVLC
jgi:hypothetical protein